MFRVRPEIAPFLSDELVDSVWTDDEVSEMLNRKALVRATGKGGYWVVGHVVIPDKASK